MKLTRKMKVIEVGSGPGGGPFAVLEMEGGDCGELTLSVSREEARDLARRIYDEVDVTIEIEARP